MAKELTESRRTRYTRLAMQDALVELLQDQPLGSITVKALCERADVNRSTFYAHYTSIEDLLHDIEDETMAWVTAALDQLLAQPDSAGIEHVIERICQYIADNRKHLQVLMSPKADIGFQQQLLGLIYSRQTVAEQLQPAANDPVEAPNAHALRRIRQHRPTAILARHRPRSISGISGPHHFHHGHARLAVNWWGWFDGPLPTLAVSIKREYRYGLASAFFGITACRALQ